MVRYKTLIMIRSLRSEQASTYRNIKPFADLIGGLIESQAAEPIERITQRPEAGSWTALPPASN